MQIDASLTDINAMTVIRTIPVYKMLHALGAIYIYYADSIA